MLVIATFYRLKQEDLQYEAILEYIARLKKRKKKVRKGLEISSRAWWRISLIPVLGRL